MSANKKPQGAIFIIQCGEEVLLLKELKDKPNYGKVAGMLSVPMETEEDYENGNVLATARRGLWEEVGLSEREVPELESIGELSYPHIEATVFLIIASEKFPVVPAPDAEVAYHGWVPVKRLREVENLRPEMPAVIALLEQVGILAAA